MRGRPLDLCVALVAIAWLSVTFGLGFDSAPGRGSNADRATRTPSEQKDAAPGAREGAGEPLDPGADPFPRVTPLAPETQGRDAPQSVPSKAPPHDEPQEHESRRGSCVIAVRAPEALPCDATFSITAVVIRPCCE